MPVGWMSGALLVDLLEQPDQRLLLGGREGGAGFGFQLGGCALGCHDQLAAGRREVQAHRPAIARVGQARASVALDGETLHAD